MSFDIGEAVNNTVDYLCNSSLLHGIINNPFIVALLLVAIVVSIFLGFFYSNVKYESKLQFVKLYIYSFLIAATILLLHYRCQEKDIEKSFGVERGTQLFEAVTTETPQTTIGGAFNKVVDSSCGCTGNAQGGLRTGDYSDNKLSGLSSGGGINNSTQIQSLNPSDSASLTKFGQASGGMQEKQISSGNVERSAPQEIQQQINKTGGVPHVNVAKIAIKPTTKSPFTK